MSAAVKAKRVLIPNRATMKEREIADLRLGTFVAEGSRGMELLQRIYPSGELTRRSLYSFASLIAALSGIKLGRDYTRRKELLIKWFDENYYALEPYSKFFVLEPNTGA